MEKELLLSETAEFTRETGLRASNTASELFQIRKKAFTRKENGNMAKGSGG